MQKLQLSIPKPCHENWQNMTATEQGRFCNACAKEVIDFSMMTDSEVLNYFTTITNNNVCGRVLPSQLNRPITYPMQIKKKMYWYWNYMVMFFMFFGKSNAIKAQGKIVAPVAQNQVKRSHSPNGEVVVVAGAINKVATKTIQGKVTDNNKNPIAYASILIKGTKTGVVADAKGLFTIKAPQGAVLMISAVGYQTSAITVNEKTVMNIMLNDEFSNLVLGGISYNGNKHENDKVIYEEESDSTEFKKVKQLDTVTVKAAIPLSLNEALTGMVGGISEVRVISANQNETKFKTIEATNNMKVYPNPAMHGNSIQLDMNLKETGLYQVQVTDAVYRTLYYKRINAVSKQQNEKIVCDSKWAAGIYFIRIFDSKNSLVNESSFIVQ